MTLLTTLPLLIACGSGPSQSLPGPTSAERRGLEGEVIETVTYEYTESGLLRSRSSSLGQRIRFFHDEDQRLAVVDFPQGPSDRVEEMLVYGYDILGRIASIDRQLTDSGEIMKSTAFRYDNDGRLSRRYEDGAPFEYEYDAIGRLVQETPMREGSVVSYVYRDQGLLRHKDAGATRTIYEQDEHGNVLSETIVDADDENLVRERWVYDFGGWSELSETARAMAPVDSPYLSASHR